MRIKSILLYACAYVCTCVCACVRVDVEDVNFCRETIVDFSIDHDFSIPKELDADIDKTIYQRTEFNVSDIVPDISEFGSLKLILSKNIIESVESDLANIESAVIYLSYTSSDGSEKTQNIGGYSGGTATNSIDLLSSKDIDLAKLSGVRNCYINFVFTLKKIEAKTVILKQTICVNGSANIEKNFIF